MNEYTEGRNLIRRIEFVFICKEDDYITEILGSATSIGVFRGGLWGGGRDPPPWIYKILCQRSRKGVQKFRLVDIDQLSANKQIYFVNFSCVSRGSGNCFLILEFFYFF